MVEIDSDSFEVKKLWRDNTDANVHFLLTQERAQALELLVHLIANATDPIIVCGPEGVGKTQLLNVLQHRKIASCFFCPLAGDKELSLNQVQEYIEKARKQDQSVKYDRNFARAQGEQGASQKKWVLIIDNAGVLAPGLMTQIVRYANETAYVQVILVLTHDQLHLKYRSDQAIDDCRIVEVASLSEKQCGDFLQHLSTKSSAALPASAITDELVKAIYNESHGVPAKIIEKFSEISSPKHLRRENSGLTLVIAVAGLIALALCVQWYSSRQPITESIATVTAVQQTEEASLNEPPPTFPTLLPIDNSQSNYLHLNVDENPEQGNETVSGPLSINVDQNRRDFPSQDIKPPIENAPKPAVIEAATEQPELQQTPVTAAASEKKTAAAASAAKLEGADWLSSQPENHYTLQLMVLSKEQSIHDVIKRHPGLQQDFKYVRRLLNGKEKFILLYGSYNSSGTANAARRTLPTEFQKSLVRKVSAINKEMRLESAN